jgi:signal transduction protein with GAF and PtsI domain
MTLLEAPLQGDAQILYRILMAVSSGMDTQAVMDILVERTVTELGYRAATLQLFDAERGALELQAAFKVRPAHRSLHVREEDWGDTAAHVPPIPVDAVSEGGQKHVGESITVPLALGSRTLGVLRVYAATPRIFDDQERGLLADIATLGASVIARVTYTTALQQIAAALMESLELNTVLRTLVVQITQALEAPAGSLRLLDPRHQTLNLAAAHGLSRAYMDREVVSVAESGIDQHILTRSDAIARTELWEGHDWPYPEEAQREGMRAMLAAPLRLRGEGFGVLRVYTDTLRRFSPAELAFVSKVVELGSLAIDSARRHEALKARLIMDSSAWRRFLTRS